MVDFLLSLTLAIATPIEPFPRDFHVALNAGAVPPFLNPLRRETHAGGNLLRRYDHRTKNKSRKARHPGRGSRRERARRRERQQALPSMDRLADMLLFLDMHMLHMRLPPERRYVHGRKRVSLKRATLNRKQSIGSVRC